MSRVLVLRPEPGASETARRARALGLDPIVIPLFEIEPIDWEVPPGHFNALLLTSANAVRFAGHRLAELRALPVHAVGEATASAARDAGFRIAAVGEAGIERLLDSIDPDLDLLHLCGSDRIPVSEARQEITPVAVYRSREVTNPDGLEAAQGAVAMVHSPRAALRFAQIATERSIGRGNIAVAAISEAAARSVGEGWRAVSVAERPADEALLALASQLCDKMSGDERV